MQFQKGNKFWLARSSHGRNPIFSNPEQLRNACYEYFEWVENNPLYEEKIFHSQGMITKDTITKMRAMTIRAMCFFIGLSRQGSLSFLQSFNALYADISAHFTSEAALAK